MEICSESSHRGIGEEVKALKAAGEVPFRFCTLRNVPKELGTQGKKSQINFCQNVS